MQSRNDWLIDETFVSLLLPIILNCLKERVLSN